MYIGTKNIESIHLFVIIIIIIIIMVLIIIIVNYDPLLHNDSCETRKPTFIAFTAQECSNIILVDYWLLSIFHFQFSIFDYWMLNCWIVASKYGVESKATTG